MAEQIKNKNKGFFTAWFEKKNNNGSESISSTPVADAFSELITEQERTFLSNILKLRDLIVMDVMIPRADIFAVDSSLSQGELFELLAERQFSRVPVYNGTLDDVVGTIHIKDVMAVLARGETVEIGKLVMSAPFVSPTMTILDLIRKMRKSRRHIAFVVDEFGGIDGLVTINDVVEAIVGRLRDEHDNAEQPKMIVREDGSILADARLGIEEFEKKFGPVLTESDRDQSDTIGGLVMAMAGHVPLRGEILRHENGMVFEVLDAEAQHVSLVRIRNIPTSI